MRTGEILAQSPPRLPSYNSGSLPSGAAGDLAYNSTTGAPNYHDGSAWNAIGGGLTSASLIAVREGLRVEKTAAYTIQVNPGRCVLVNASGDRDVAILSSALTKTINNAWVVGSGNGGLDTGAIANTTYHLYLIKRPDTGVVDVLASTSLTPTLPTNYTHYRRIWSVVVQSSAIRDFDAYGNLCKWRSPARDLDNYSVSTSGELRALTVPTGINVEAIGVLSPGTSAVGNGGNGLAILALDPGQTAYAPTVGAAEFGTFDATAGGALYSGFYYTAPIELRRVTDASGRIYFRRTGAYDSGTRQTTFQTLGYIDLALDSISGSLPTASNIVSYTLASRPSASSVPVGTIIFINDWGVAGCYLKSDGSHWASAFRQTLHRLTVPVDFTGSTASQILSSFLVPAGVPHPNGIFALTGVGGRSAGTASTVLPQMRVGANTTGGSTLVYSNGNTAMQVFQRYLIFQNSLTQQVCPSGGNTSYAANGSLPTDLGYNVSTTDLWLTAGGALSNAADTLRLQFFSVEYM